MECRQANTSDLPAIVDLLKQSLGESLMPKSEGYWRWKHVDNPFGTSPVLLCWDGDLLVGVRAFMRWQWKDNGNIFRAIRAVDTATHPKYQGKGIFKKLTLSLVDLCKQEGDHFIFNTPNTQSKPGYIKMGWQEAGKLPVRFYPNRPFSILRNLTGAPQTSANADAAELLHYLDHPSLAGLVNKQLQQTESIVTNASADYLNWRYRHVPVASYVAVGDESGNDLNGLVIGRLKPSRLGNELRITDVFLTEPAAAKPLLKKLKQKMKAWQVDYTTLAGTAAALKNVLPVLHVKAAVGPIVTVRDVALQDLGMLKNFNRWSPSLGDLELF